MIWVLYAFCAFVFMTAGWEFFMTAGWEFFVMPDTRDSEVGPPGAAPALRFMFGLFWPIVVVAGSALLAYVLVRSVVGGFVALWRHYRGERVPRATARRRI